MLFGLIKTKADKELESKVADTTELLAAMPVMSVKAAKEGNEAGVKSVALGMLDAEAKLTELHEGEKQAQYGDGFVDGALIATGVFGAAAAIGLAILRHI